MWTNRLDQKVNGVYPYMSILAQSRLIALEQSDIDMSPAQSGFANESTQEGGPFAARDGAGGELCTVDTLDGGSVIAAVVTQRFAKASSEARNGNRQRRPCIFELNWKDRDLPISSSHIYG